MSNQEDTPPQQQIGFLVAHVAYIPPCGTSRVDSSLEDLALLGVRGLAGGFGGSSLHTPRASARGNREIPKGDFDDCMTWISVHWFISRTVWNASTAQRKLQAPLPLPLCAAELESDCSNLS